MSSFVGALGLFGENLGRIEEINIKGLDVEMIIVYKYNLIFVAILAKEFVKQDIRDEAEKSLDMFYSLYRKEIKEDYNEVSQFTSFKNILFTQIEEYLNRIKDSQKAPEIGDFGFFTDAIKKLRSNSIH
ncbi:MAG: hypothetical protein ACFFG0_41770 [Candidatus Thorarchaeota archaeon]